MKRRRIAKLIGLPLIILSTIAFFLAVFGSGNVSEDFTVNFSRYENAGRTVVLVITNRSACGVVCWSDTGWRLSQSLYMKSKSNQEIRLNWNEGTPALQVDIACVPQLRGIRSKLDGLLRSADSRIRLLRREVFIVQVSLPLFSGVTNIERIDFVRLTEQLLSMISNTNTSDADLEEAISRLGKVSEPVSFWNRIAKDRTYSDQHRRRCILGLVKRHRPGTVYELARMLDTPAWLKDDDIEKVGLVIGLIPVQMSPGDTVFALKLLPNSWDKTSSETKAVVYINVAGTVNREDFSRAVRGEIKPGTEGSDVLNRVLVDLGTWQEPRRE